MTPDLNQPKLQPAEVDELQVERRSVPLPIIILLFVLLYWGMLYFDLRGGWFHQQVYAPYKSVAEVAQWQPPTGGSDVFDRGKVVFEMVCALCHNPDGLGKPNQGPPLAGSEWVLVENPARLIRIPLYGLNGPIEVKGQRMLFPSGMVAMGAALPDEDVAAVLTYMRQAWGNKASAVTPEQIKAVKAEVGARTQQFTPEELMKVPEK
jgi:mono/diheme cytochrome c family protein